MPWFCIISRYGDISWPTRSISHLLNYFYGTTCQVKRVKTRLAGLRNFKQRISEDTSSMSPAILLGFGKCY